MGRLNVRHSNFKIMTASRTRIEGNVREQAFKVSVFRCKAVWRLSHDTAITVASWLDTKATFMI